MRKRPPRRLPSDLPRAKAARALTRMGFHFIREGQKHSIYGDDRRDQRTVAIPRHARIKRDLLRGILGSVGISEEEFMEHY